MLQDNWANQKSLKNKNIMGIKVLGTELSKYLLLLMILIHIFSV